MLVLDGVTKLYDGQPGVRGVGLTAPSGSRTVIVGPSGSGKTTLLRLVAGFERGDAGTITLSHKALCGPGQFVPPHRRNIAYVAQEGALFPHMSVGQNIGFALPNSEPDREARIAALLEHVGLPAAMASRRPHQLSGGQQQRIALARALAQKPDLMLLDEPFSALDTGLRQAMRDMVEELLSKAGITTVLVTHDQAEALAFADHLVVMRAGKVADAGPPRRLYEQPVDCETARFMGEAIIVSGAIRNGIADTALGAIAVSHDDAAMRQILVRPEQVKIDATGAGAPGVITHCSYRGARTRLTVKLDADLAPIVIDMPAASDFSQGDAVSLGIEGSGHIFADRA